VSAATCYFLYHAAKEVNIMLKKSKLKPKRNDAFDGLYRKRDRALERVVAAYEKNSEDPEELNKALDALTVAHVALAFEWASGPLSW
jgi:hemoglobin-like flavoprotein